MSREAKYSLFPMHNTIQTSFLSGTSMYHKYILTHTSVYVCAILPFQQSCCELLYFGLSRFVTSSSTETTMVETENNLGCPKNESTFPINPDLLRGKFLFLSIYTRRCTVFRLIRETPEAEMRLDIFEGSSS